MAGGLTYSFTYQATPLNLTRRDRRQQLERYTAKNKHTKTKIS